MARTLVTRQGKQWRFRGLSSLRIAGVPRPRAQKLRRLPHAGRFQAPPLSDIRCPEDGPYSDVQVCPRNVCHEARKLCHVGTMAHLAVAGSTAGNIQHSVVKSLML